MRSAKRVGIASCLAFICATCSIAFAQVFAQGVPKPILVTPLKFSDLPGRWVGMGDMAFRDGTTERMKCRIVYRLSDKRKLRQSIWCKNENMRLEIKTSIVDRNGHISGTWNDRVYSMSGDLNGRLHGNQIKAALSSTFFNAKLNIMLIGTTQTIQVTPDDGHLRSMKISLARS